MLWVGLAVFLCVCVYQATAHLLAPSRTVHDEIPPNAATVAPLSPSAHLAVLYGPAPVRLAGTPNFYVVPAATPAVLWRLDAEHSILVPVGQLPPFSSVQAIRLIRQNGMLEVLMNDHANGFISADHLTPGNAAAARRAYCGYNAGPTPHDGELLERRGNGNGTLEMENRAVQPVVVKLRDATGAVALSVFLGPGGHAAFDGLPAGNLPSGVRDRRTMEPSVQFVRGGDAGAADGGGGHGAGQLRLWWWRARAGSRLPRIFRIRRSSAIERSGDDGERGRSGAMAALGADRRRWIAQVRRRRDCRRGQAIDGIGRLVRR